MKLTLEQIVLPVIHGQATPAPKPLRMEDVFKNVQVLKGIPVNPLAAGDDLDGAKPKVYTRPWVSQTKKFRKLDTKDGIETAI